MPAALFDPTTAATQRYDGASCRRSATSCALGVPASSTPPSPPAPPARPKPPPKPPAGAALPPPPANPFEGAVRPPGGEPNAKPRPPRGPAPGPLIAPAGPADGMAPVWAVDAVCAE